MSGESNEGEAYTHDDLLADIEVLRKAGLIEVTGITDSGDWLYGMSELGKKTYEELGEISSEMLEELLSQLLDEAEDDDSI